jgi:transcriptional regulator with XRE-family HTH domain
MLFSQVGPETLNKELNSYLGTSKLSLSQVAKRLGVSKGHLSEIKNGKAQPALNTGLRILKMCGLETEHRKAWAHFYNTSISEEYLEVHDDWEKEHSRKLTEKVSILLAKDIELMNAYVDIVGEEEKGMELVELRMEYGKPIEKKLQKLVAQEVLAIETTEIGKVYKAGLVDPIITKNASYDLIKSVVEVQQFNFQSGEHKGAFKFHINDVDQEGYEQLEQLLERTMKEASEIFLNNQKTRKEGGERFAFEIMLGKLKSFVIFALLSFAAFNMNMETSYAQGGGLSGGSSRTTILEAVEKLPWTELQKEQILKINWPEVYMSGEYVRVSDLCHYPGDNTIKTNQPIKTCVSTKLVSYYCYLSTAAENQDCEQIPDGMVEDYVPFNEDRIGHIIVKRECQREEFRNHEIKLNSSGVFVRFNDARTGDPRRHTVLPNLEDHEVFTFDIEVFIERSGIYGNYKEKIGSKPFEMPICL